MESARDTEHKNDCHFYDPADGYSEDSCSIFACKLDISSIHDRYLDAFPNLPLS